MKKKYITATFLKSINMTREQYHISLGKRYPADMTHAAKLRIAQLKKNTRNNCMTLTTVNIVEEDSLMDTAISKLIKEKYKITVIKYGGIVADVNFELKHNAKDSISVILKKSDNDYAHAIFHKDFVDSVYKNAFINIARKLVDFTLVVG